MKERGGVEQYQGRDIKSEDNGNVSGKHLARAFPTASSVERPHCPERSTRPRDEAGVRVRSS